MAEWETSTNDYQERFEVLLKEASECELIARLAANPAKRQRFLKLADRYRDMADDMREAIAEASAKRSEDPGCKS